MQCRLKATSGFSLIELLIVMVIVAILTAIAYPSYQTHVMRTHRNAAKACLSEYAHFMERYYTSNLTYVGAVPGVACQGQGAMPQRYTFATGALTAKTYTVTATPIGVQVSDTQCAVLGIDQTGTQTASGAGGPAACW